MDKIIGYVEAMFSTLPRTKEVVDMKLQIIEHMQDQFSALVEGGKNENEALGTVIAAFGSVDEIRRELHLEGVLPDETPVPSVSPPPPPGEDPELAGLKMDYYAFKPRAYKARAVAVGLFILSTGPTYWTAMLSFVMIAIGVGILIYYNGRLHDYATLIDQRLSQLGMPPMFESAARPSSKQSAFIKNKRGALYATLWLGAVVVYLLAGFLFNLWHPGWIIFLLVPLLTSVLELSRASDHARRRNDEEDYR